MHPALIPRVILYYSEFIRRPVPYRFPLQFFDEKINV
jgi:hypothetical protein